MIVVLMGRFVPLKCLIAAPAAVSNCELAVRGVSQSAIIQDWHLDDRLSVAHGLGVDDNFQIHSLSVHNSFQCYSPGRQRSRNPYA